MNKLYNKIFSENIGFLLLLLFGILWRLFKFVPNLVPIEAISLFAGAHYSRKKSLFLVLAIMLVSDFFIGFYQWQLMLSVYGSFLLIVLLGRVISKKQSFENIVKLSISSSVLFFLVTNFSVWLFSSWYQHSFSGLLFCYFLALSFLKNSFISTLFFTPVLFYGYEEMLVLRRRFFDPAKKVKSISN